MSILGSSEVFALGKLSRRVAADRRATVEGFVHWLRAQLEPRTLLYMKCLRAARLTLAAGLALGLLALGIDARFGPNNIALHKLVTISSRHPGTPDPSGATDGKVVAPFQAHTSIEGDPWIRVDLGREYEISKVKIYNRTDCLFGGALPLTLEFSTDGTNFQAVDQRTRDFTGTWPWIFRTKGARARFVRVHGHSGGYVVVTEIEVFGR
jgi:hypothetical protein